MGQPTGSKNLIQAPPEELTMAQEDRIELIAALLVEIICEELCTTA